MSTSMIFKACFFSIGVCLILFGCVPTTQLYQTPPLYFGNSHFVPERDSSRTFTASAEFVTPYAAQLKVIYRFNRNYLAGITYHGNVGTYSKRQSNDFSYEANTNAVDVHAALSQHKENKAIGWFVAGGLGWGSSTSVVPEHDNLTQFVYKGSFNRLTIIPGLDIRTGERSKLIFSWRQSFVQFQKYQLPDTSYLHQQQFLSDIMLRFSMVERRAGVHILIGSFLNGRGPGDRQMDLHPEQWRVEYLFGGFGVTYQFARLKKS